MAKVLNITNGDSAVQIMQEAKIQGEFLPWRDVLHEGPVLPLEFQEFCKVRAEFIFKKGWGERKFIEDDFKHKINIIENITNYDKVILWFEHDLYDQLQLLQILDLLSNKDINISMICTENYLGEQTPDSLIELQKFEKKVTKEQFNLATKAWDAFRSDTPFGLQKLLDEDSSALPFLKESIKRILQEYPSCDNGLNLTSKLAFQAIEEGEKKPWKIFESYQQKEKSRFMGDSSFWSLLNGYINTPYPLLQTKYGKKISLPFEKDEEIFLTELGKEVLECKKNWLDFGEIDKYIGGVHLNSQNLHCYNEKYKIMER
jgi:hypothetical protein